MGLKYKLLIKYLFVSLIFIFNSNLNIQAYEISNLDNSEIKDNSQNLNIDYLKSFPNNDFYILGPGDVINILVSRDYPPGLSTTSTIDGEGTIYIPRLNKVYVEGLTITELNNLLNKAFKEFVKFPEVKTTITRYRPIKVLVKGEVENPGIQRLQGFFSIGSSLNLDNSTKNDIGNGIQTYYFPTVFDVLRASGGITQFSDLSNIKIIRRNNLSEGGGKMIATLNFENSLTIGDNSGNIRIFDEDIIEVSKSKFSNQALLSKAIINNINPRFINVFVGESLLTSTNEVLTEITTPVRGIFQPMHFLN